MIDFDEALHRYSHRGVTYLSATQIVELYKDPFDAVRAASDVSERRGGSPEYWTSSWKELNRVSLVRGGTLHDLKEDVVINRQIDVIDGHVLPVPNTNLFHDAFPYIQWPDGSYPELKLWNHKHRIAGRTDKAMLFTRYGTGQPRRHARIHDYKTGRVIRHTSYWDPRTRRHCMMRPPVEHLMSCTWIEYCLQLSLYAYMLEEMGFIIDSLTMEHFPHIEPEAPAGAVAPRSVIDIVPYLRNDVHLILKHLDEHTR